VFPVEPDPAVVSALAAELHLPAPVARLLALRGFAAPDAAKRYLRPRLDHLHPPTLMRGLDQAVERLAQAVRAREPILVHGDYDVDGMCSTALLIRTIRGLGGTAIPFIPRRLEDGYDLSDAGVRGAVEAGARVVVTCDCGTTALAPVAALCAAGIDVIVTDHHVPGGDLPECLAVLNPKIAGCGYPDTDLAAVGVAFKLAMALAERMGASTNPVLGMLDLVALATIADIAPLRGENRVFSRYGLKLLAGSRNAGLRALIRSSGLEGKVLTAGRIGFVLAPRLNAVGRLGHALRGVQLLLTDDDHEALRIARELEELNRRRQDIDRETLDDARKMLAAPEFADTFGLVLAREGWHPGVIGIVASRVVEETGKPTLLIAIKDGEGKGSGRSIPIFDLHGALASCRHLMLRFGGHRAAAGVTVARDRIPELARSFDAAARAVLRPEDLAPEIRIDLEVSIGDATPELESLLRHFEPFGVGNPGPVLLSRGVRLNRAPRIVGENGLKLSIATPTGETEALGWGMAHRLPEVRDPFDIVYRLEREEWNGRSKLVAKLVDFRT
jgi:single-stranded-DNA-specific exonuclease